MPRFYFDLTNGEGLLCDEEGAELDEIEAARAFARRAIRDLVASEVRDGREVRLGHYVTIRDAAGAEVERMHYGEAVRFAQ